MPITSSAKKAMRQSRKRAMVNRERKDTLKDTVKKYRKAVAKSPEEAKKLLSGLYQVIDKSVKGKVIKKNTASRMKSRLSRLVK